MYVGHHMLLTISLL